MKLDSIIEKLLEFESSKKILSFKFKQDDILIWPFVRYYIFQSIINEQLQLQKAHSSEDNNSIKDKFFTHWTRIFNNPFLKPGKHKIMILGWTSNTTGNKVNNKYMNKRDDYFADLLPEDTILLEKSVKGIFRYPRTYKKVCNRDIIDILSKIYCKISKPSLKDIETIKEFIKHLRTSLPFSIDKSILNSIHNSLINISKQLYYKKKLYKKIVKMIDPIIVFIQN